MTSKEMPIEKVRKMLPLDWEAMKKLGHDEDDLDQLESEITDAIAGHLCPGDFLPGERHEDGDCPNDCSACWGWVCGAGKDDARTRKAF